MTGRNALRLPNTLGIAQINGGKMDKFVAIGNVGALAMSYYDVTNLPLGRFAQQYVLCDNFFQAVLGGSTLNHIWLVAAATPVWPEAPPAMRVQLDRHVRLQAAHELGIVRRAVGDRTGAALRQLRDVAVLGENRSGIGFLRIASRLTVIRIWLLAFLFQ